MDPWHETIEFTTNLLLLLPKSSLNTLYGNFFMNQMSP